MDARLGDMFLELGEINWLEESCGIYVPVLLGEEPGFRIIPKFVDLAKVL